MQPRISLIFGCALGTAAALAGCGDEASLPLGVGAQGSTGGSSAGAAGAPGGSATAGTASGGSGTSGSATTAGSGGTALGTAGTSVNAGAGSGGVAGGSAGSAGSGGSAGNAGNAGSAGAAGTAGSAGSGGADGCPDDADKTEPGVCGCGVAETDTDGDTTPDCTDLCPEDAAKTALGLCGCGLSDTANADGDAAVDCKDACPNNAALTVAGTCGCLPDSLGASCLAHRYQFDGTGAVATDSIAASGNGTIVGATLSGTGTLVLAGGTSDQYVKLPSGLISALGNSATIEAWVTWAGTGGEWQRIFDFGNSTGGQDMQGDGQSYLFLTPRATGTALRVAISAAGGGAAEDLVSAATALPAATLSHVAVVIDGTAKTLALYRNGVSDGTAAAIRATTTLTGLKDVNNWLGRSQYQSDEELAGTYHELRIYSRSLSAAQIGASFTAGPDALP